MTRLKFGESFLFFRRRKINGLISSRGSNIELRIEIGARSYPIKPRHCERHVAFVLSGPIFAEIKVSKRRNSPLLSDASHHQHRFSLSAIESSASLHRLGISKLLAYLLRYFHHQFVLIAWLLNQQLSENYRNLNLVGNSFPVQNLYVFR
ncbi:hypothetical protein ABFS83_12G045900 [Erythranthe nasuta]